MMIPRAMAAEGDAAQLEEEPGQLAQIMAGFKTRDWLFFFHLMTACIRLQRTLSQRRTQKC